MGKISVFLSLAVFAGSAFADNQQSTCVPATPEAASWPVKAIYLHGLFNAHDRRDVTHQNEEAANRVALAKAAARFCIRIAIPVSKRLDGPGVQREWNFYDQAQIEAAASAVCKAPLSPNRALIGFSNGGAAARRIALQSCAETSEYHRIYAIGYPDGTAPSSCKNGQQLVNQSPHVFPNVSQLEAMLAFTANHERVSVPLAQHAAEAAPAAVPVPAAVRRRPRVVQASGGWDDFSEFDAVNAGR